MLRLLLVKGYVAIFKPSSSIDVQKDKGKEKKPPREVSF